MYERVQQHGEPLAMYVQAVCNAALVLCITETEDQIVARIVEGLTPVQRACFVFQTVPSTFAQLDKLIVLDCNITYADSTRRVAVLPGGNIVGADVNKSSVKHSPRTVSNTSVQGNQHVCYYCGKSSHMQSNCFCALLTDIYRCVLRAVLTKSQSAENLNFMSWCPSQSTVIV
jgi:hypothetical protein